MAYRYVLIWEMHHDQIWWQQTAIQQIKHALFYEAHFVVTVFMYYTSL